MPTNDVFLPLKKWESTLFRGDKPNIDRFLQQLDVGLPVGWRRDSDHEHAQKQPASVQTYLYEHPGDESLRLWLKWVTPTRVRGWRVEFMRYRPQDQVDRIATVVAEFTNSHALPTAAATGVRATNPTFGPRSIVPVGVATKLVEFANRFDGAWPLPEEYLKEDWYDFLSYCLAEQVGFDAFELAKWFADNGWEPSAAQKLTDKLFADSTWLAKRLEVAASW